MAPVPPTTTSRLKVGYTGPAGNHVMLFHGASGATEANLKADAAAVIEEILPLLWNGTSFNTAQFALAGSNLFFPTSWTTLTAATANTYGVNDSPSKFLQLGGRGPDGVRVKLYFFEHALEDNNDMRVQSEDNAALAAALTLLNDSGSWIGTISGTRADWYAYGNLGYNDYITHAARR